MPRGSTLEQTDEVARALGSYLATRHEVTDYETNTGLAPRWTLTQWFATIIYVIGGYVVKSDQFILAKDRREQQSHEMPYVFGLL